MKKSIPKVRERESEASILGNDREREFPLTPGGGCLRRRRGPGLVGRGEDRNERTEGRARRKEEAKGKGVDGVSVEERARKQSLLEDFGQQTDERREFLEGNGNGEMDLLIG